jgi:hypothetical protein
MIMINLLPSRGNQLQHLTITLNLEADFDCLELCELFPNLRSFKYKGLQSQEDFFGEFVEFKRRRHNSRISGNYQPPPATHLTMFTFNSWDRLRELELSIGFRRSKTMLFSFLEDIPSLRKLTLREGLISIQDGETIHQKLPAIKAVSNKNEIR